MMSILSTKPLQHSVNQKKKSDNKSLEKISLLIIIQSTRYSDEYWIIQIFLNAYLLKSIIIFVYSINNILRMHVHLSDQTR